MRVLTFENQPGSERFPTPRERHDAPHGDAPARVRHLGPAERAMSRRARELGQGVPVGIAGATARIAAGYRAWRSAERHLQQQAQRHLPCPDRISPTATFQDYLDYCVRVGAAAGGQAPASSPSGSSDTPSQTTSTSTVSGAAAGTREAQRLVYAQWNTGLVFIPLDRAQHLARLWRALCSAKTWGDLLRLAPPEEFKEIQQVLDRTPEQEPDLQARFDHDMLTGDGDFPPWPAQEMLDWMPEEVQTQYGVVWESAHNGPVLELAARDVFGIVAALRRHGFLCRQDSTLVAQANGDVL